MADDVHRVEPQVADQRADVFCCRALVELRTQLGTRCAVTPKIGGDHREVFGQAGYHVTPAQRCLRPTVKEHHRVATVAIDSVRPCDLEKVEKLHLGAWLNPSACRPLERRSRATPEF